MNINELDHLTGIDVSLEISLLEYGMAWDSTAYEEDNKCEVDFIIGSDYDGESYTEFYYTSMDKSEFGELFDVKSWCNVADVAKCSGLTIKQLYQSFPYSIHDFILYYGAESVLGSPPYHTSAYFSIEVD